MTQSRYRGERPSHQRKLVNFQREFKYQQIQYSSQALPAMRPFSLLLLTAVVAVTATSCELFKPKEQPAAAYDPYGQQSNPYGQPAAAANPYGQAPAANPYGQAPAANPYGQTPASNPYGSYEPAQTYTAPPSTPYSSAPAASGGSGRTVTVQSGDTLTSIAKRNGTSVSALRSANGLTGDLIRVGQKLTLP
jgi:LysM repeat protein